MSAEEAITAVSEAKFGLDGAHTSVLTKVRSGVDFKETLFSAAKKGFDHILVTLIGAGDREIDVRDENFNTPLHFAAKGGFIAATALLLEKGSDLKATNNNGWTALHFVASVGCTDSHFECAKFLLEMGIDVMAESNSGETAADVAQRCASRFEIVQLLKAIEVEVAMEEVSYKSKTLAMNSVDMEEKRFARTLSTLVNFITMLTDNESSSVKSSSIVSSVVSDSSGEGKVERSTESDDISDAVIVDRYILYPPKALTVEKELFRNNRTYVDRAVSPIIDELGVLLEDITINDRLEGLLHEKKEWEERCQQLMTEIDESTIENSAMEKNWDKDYFELIRESKAFKSDFQIALEEKRAWERQCCTLMEQISLSNRQYEKIQMERNEWELRCRNVMVSLANLTKEHKREICILDDEHDLFKMKAESDMIQYKATCSNKLNKQKQEYELKLEQLQHTINECDATRNELLQFQKKMKLTWIPDEVVSSCQEASCLSFFTAINRKHHCRCCGRVFCLKCCQQKVELPHLGYLNPVRVCDSCFGINVDVQSVQETS